MSGSAENSILVSNYPAACTGCRDEDSFALNLPTVPNLSTVLPPFSFGTEGIEESHLIGQDSFSLVLDRFLTYLYQEALRTNKRLDIGENDDLADNFGYYLSSLRVVCDTPAIFSREEEVNEGGEAVERCDIDNWDKAFVSVVPYLPEVMLEEVFRFVLTERGEISLTYVLTELASYLSNLRITRALVTAKWLRDGFVVDSLFFAVGSYTTKSVPDSNLELVGTIVYARRYSVVREDMQAYSVMREEELDNYYRRALILVGSLAEYSQVADYPSNIKEIYTFPHETFEASLKKMAFVKALEDSVNKYILHDEMFRIIRETEITFEGYILVRSFCENLQLSNITYGRYPNFVMKQPDIVIFSLCRSWSERKDFLISPFDVFRELIFKDYNIIDSRKVDLHVLGRIYLEKRCRGIKILLVIGQINTHYAHLQKEEIENDVIGHVAIGYNGRGAHKGNARCQCVFVLVYVACVWVVCITLYRRCEIIRRGLSLLGFASEGINAVRQLYSWERRILHFNCVMTC